MIAWRGRVAMAIGLGLVGLPAAGAVQDLHRAIYEGDIAAIRAAIAVKSVVNRADNRGWTPLMRAAAYAKGPRIEIVRALLDAGAALEAVNDEGDTALIAATYYARLNVDVVRLLLERGAKVNARKKDGRTPLTFAASNYEPDVTEVLIKAGATIDNVDAEGNTPLLAAMRSAGVPAEMGMEYAIALEKRMLPTLDLLLNHGANPNVKNKKGETPLSPHVARWEQMTRGGLPALGQRLRAAGAR